MACGPYICDFAAPGEYKWCEEWECPNCGTTYRRGRKAKDRWWRNWSAPDGSWHLPLWGSNAPRPGTY